GERKAFAAGSHMRELMADQHRNTGPVGSAAAGGGACRLFGGLQPLLSPSLRPGLDRGFANRRLLNKPGVAEEACDPIGRQRSDPEPMLDAFGLQRHPIGMRSVEHRIIGSELFDKAAVAGTVRIRDDNAVVRALLCAAARKADSQ